jgi:hypothetical protein
MSKTASMWLYPTLILLSTAPDAMRVSSPRRAHTHPHALFIVSGLRGGRTLVGQRQRLAIMVEWTSTSYTSGPPGVKSFSWGLEWMR